jgi:hypothetical protein
MTEIEVVLDVRPSLDKPELIVTKQKLAAEGNNLHLVGEPREERVEMGPRVKITMGELATAGIGDVLTAQVANVGLSPLEISSVDFVFPEDRSRTGKPKVTSFGFQPVNRVNGPLLPAHARTYYLPMEYYDLVVHKARTFQPQQYHVAVFIGDKEVGRLGGEDVKPFLDRSKIEIVGRAQIAFDTLHELERMQLLQLLSSIADQDPSSWGAANVRRVDQASQLYLVRLSPHLQAVITPSTQGGIQLLDLVHDETLKQFETGKDAGRRE